MVCIMTVAFIGPTDVILSALAPPKYDRHIQGYKWHLFMMNSNPNYLADIAARQADKRAAGIGPEGMCRHCQRVSGFA